MSELGTMLAKMMTRTMVLGTFDDPAETSTLVATTHTGSTYRVALKPGPVCNVQTEGQDYVCREADVTINGERQVGGRIMAGYNLHQGTIFVFDTDPKRFIRRSSTIRQFDLVH